MARWINQPAAIVPPYMDRLATSVIEHVESRKAEGVAWSPEEYYADLDATFGLEPLVIGELRSVLAYVEPQRYRSGGEVKTGYVAEARIPYTGSPGGTDRLKAPAAK